jgi:hypothetical protein
VRRLPHGRVIHAQVAADRADHDLPGIEPDADLDLDAQAPAHLVRVAPESLLHPERGVARAHGVVFVGNRRAEQRHDAVTHDLVHGALVAMHGFHHEFEDGVEDIARLLGVAIREQLHRALEVGEEHGHLLPLALQGSPGGENAFGEVLRRVGLRRGAESLCRRRRGG